MHCDICCSFPLYDILKFHQSHGKMATLLATQVKPEESKRYGCFVYEPNTKGNYNQASFTLIEVKHFSEKPELFMSNTINCGVYLFTVEDLYTQALFKNYGDRYAKILEISKDEGEEQPLEK